MRLNCKKTLLAGAMVAVLAAINTQAGLTHRYSFNDKTAPGKDSVGSATATLMNMTSDNITTLNSNSKLGVQFANIGTGTTLLKSSDTNGQYVVLPTNVIAGAKALTFETWTDLADTAVQSAGTWSRIFDVGDPFFNPGSGHNFLTLCPHTGSGGSQLEFNMNGNGNTAQYANSLEGYHHVMAVADSVNGFMELFVDGVKVSHSTTTYNVTNISNRVFWLGRSEYSGDDYLYGYIDEFRIYDRALSGIEAAADFAVGSDVINPNIASTLGTLQTVALSDPGHILELHSATTLATADYAGAASGTNYSGLSLFNATGFTLTSSDPTVATVDAGGVIKALKPGTTTLTATYGGKTGTLVITVDADTVAPTVTKIDNLGYDRLIQVTFSKPVDPVTAQNPANYTIDQGVTVSRAILATNGLVVTLYTSQFDANGKYTLTVNGVLDTVFTPNAMQQATGQFGTGLGTAELPVGEPLIRRIYTQAAGFTVDNLANGMKSAGYPYQGGTELSLANGLSDTVGKHGDNYFSSVSGWLIAPTTASYHFALACDDDAAIYVSPTDSEGDLPTSPTLQALGWSPAGHFLGDGGAEAYTGPNAVSMVAGQRYFFRAIMRNGTGGDNFDVAWAPVGTAFTDGQPSIPAANCQAALAPETHPMKIITQPVDVQIGQNNDATFSVVVSSYPLYTGVQWYQVSTNGVTNAITNGNALSYTAALVTTNMNGMKYFAVVSNLVDTVTTSQAKLSVSSDNVPPQLVAVIAGMQVGAGATNVTVYFNERVSSNTAAAKGNYVVNGFTVTSAVYDSTTMTNVYLGLSSPMTAGAPYNLTVNGVKDLAGNVIDSAHKSLPFHAAALASGWCLTETWAGSGSPDDAWTRKQTLTPTSTKVASWLGTPDWGGDSYNNYVAMNQGYIVPPVTGDYVFYVAADDNGRFYLDEIAGDSDPANLTLLCQVNGWAGMREWNGANAGGKQVSASVNLTAGSKYYFQARYNDGGGGDGIIVDWALPGTTTPVDITGASLFAIASVDLSSVTITTNPVSQTTAEGVPVTFTVAGVGSSQFGTNLLYQWLKNGAPIPGATAASYTIGKPGPYYATDAAGYSCVLSMPLLSKTSSVATLTIVKDTAVTTVLSAGAFAGSTTVGVRFTGIVDPVTGVDVTKYTIPGYTVQSAAVRTNASLDSVHGDMVALTVTPAVSAGAKLTVKNVKNVYGNVIPNATVDVGISDLTAQDVVNTAGAKNDPQVLGVTEPTGTNSFRITGGGSDIWGNGDTFQYAYKSVSGDFDARARVANLDHSDDWAKSGLMIRESLDTNSVMVYQMTTPASVLNLFAAGMRIANTGGAADLPFVVGVSNRPVGLNYPNAWVRVTRLGTLITAWYSTNGTTWLRESTNDMSAASPALGDSLYVGIGVTAHNNDGRQTVSDVYDFTVAPYTGEPLGVPKLTATIVGNNVVLSWDSVAGAGCTLVSSADVSVPSAQWAAAGLSVTDDGVTASVTITPNGKQFYQLKR